MRDMDDERLISGAFEEHTVLVDSTWINVVVRLTSLIYSNIPFIDHIYNLYLAVGVHRKWIENHINTFLISISSLYQCMQIMLTLFPYIPLETEYRSSSIPCYVHKLHSLSIVVCFQTGVNGLQ